MLKVISVPHVRDNVLWRADRIRFFNERHSDV